MRVELETGLWYKSMHKWSQPLTWSQWEMEYFRFISYFPWQWKVVQKNRNITGMEKTAEASFYRLLQNKLYIKRLKNIIEEWDTIFNHQFEFYNKHGSIARVRRIVNSINKYLERISNRSLVKCGMQRYFIQPNICYQFPSGFQRICVSIRDFWHRN